MNLFLKIFLWFLAAIALMVGTVVFLNWSVQTEPVVSRWRVSVRSQTTIYAATAAQLLDNGGEPALAEYLDRLRRAETIMEVDVIGQSGRAWLSQGVTANAYRELTDRTFASSDVEFEMGHPDTALTARSFTANDGERFVLIVRWDRPRPTPLFGESYLRYLRLATLLLTALLVCWALARYISSPIQKIRRATRKLASGDLEARVGDEVGNRRDELAALAKDFDVMAERIESLILSQKRLSRDVSHELRSPLARMNVALEIAKQRSNGGAAPLLDRIEKESVRLNEMISRLLTLSKLESGSKDFERYELDLKELVANVVADADFEARATGKSVRFDAPESCRVFGNGTLLASAIENVLRNAVRYTRDGTEVDVSLSVEKGKAAVRVLDHGGGVPEEELGKLFKPFHRVGEARERTTGGIGLGLAIAEGAVRAHSGTITARNSGDGLLVQIELDCLPRNGKD